VILITFIALPIRDIIAAAIIKSWGNYRVQILDVIGAGLLSVAVLVWRPECWMGRAASRPDREPS
jgi:hypothetical protein